MRIFVNFLLIVRVFAVSRLRLCGLPVDIERVRRGLLFEQDPGEDPGGGQERDDGDQLAHADARGEQRGGQLVAVDNQALLVSG